jgi:cytochrome c-type biogenesis protein CcmH
MYRFLLIGLLFAAPAYAEVATDDSRDGGGRATSGTVAEDPLERKMLDIAKDLRCAVCQNQPVSESNADLARDMRVLIREQLRQGKSRDEIVQYFVDRYGDYVLMKPPTHGSGFLLWVLPLAVFTALALSGFGYLRRRRRESLPPVMLSAEDHALVEKARMEEERS